LPHFNYYAECHYDVVLGARMRIKSSKNGEVI